MGNVAPPYECWAECDSDDKIINIDVDGPEMYRVLDELSQVRVLGTEENSVEDLKILKLHRQLTAAVMEDNAPALIELFTDHTGVAEMHKALTLAAGCGSINVVRELVGMGLSVNGQDRDSGYAPLHIAASSGYTDICDILLDALADANCQVNGSTAVSLAQRMGQAEIKELIEKHLASLSISDALDHHAPGEAANKRNQVLPRISAVLTEVVMRSDLNDDGRSRMDWNDTDDIEEYVEEVEEDTEMLSSINVTNGTTAADQAQTDASRSDELDDGIEGLTRERSRSSPPEKSPDHLQSKVSHGRGHLLVA